MEGQKPKLVILLGAPFTAHHFARLGIEILSEYCDILVLDCAYLAGRNPDSIGINRVEWASYRVVRGIEQLAAELDTFAPSFAIDDLGIDVETGYLPAMLEARLIKLVCVKSGGLPYYGLLSRMTSFLARRSPSPVVMSSGEPQESSGVISRSSGPEKLARLLRKIGHKIQTWHRRRKLAAPDIALLAGRKSLDWFSAKAARKLWIGSEDYHHFHSVVRRFEQGAVQMAPQPFILFVDNCLPYATDWKFLNIPAPISAEEYYPLLRRLFDRLENETGLPIVVAAHPNSRLVDNYGKLLGNRELFFGQTAELTIQCTAVLVHASTAISFAVLADKPIVFLTSEGLARTDYGRRVKAIAKCLVRPLIYLEAQEALNSTLLLQAPTASKYAAYIDQYLCCDLSSEKRPWGEFIDNILDTSTD